MSVNETVYQGFERRDLFNTAVDNSQNCGILCIDGLYKDGDRKMEIRKVFRSGNSLVVSLPKEVVDTLVIREGQQLIFEIKVGGVSIKPLNKPRRKGIIKEVAGCLRDDQLAKDILSLRNEDDREVVPIE